MSTQSSSFMKRAIDLAEANVASGAGGPFGCVIVKDGIIIAEGTNRVTGTNDPTAHAEIVAIRAACKHLSSFQLEACDVYASCEPCPMCLGAISWARPARLFYAADHNDATQAGFDDAFIRTQLITSPEERTLPTERLMSEEGKRPFEVWMATEGKIRY